MTTVYKILGEAEWAAAESAGVFAGSAIDLQDGYIHLSGPDTAQETARLYFSGRDDLVVLSVPAAALGPALKWEASRGGTLFPHLYGSLDVTLVSAVRAAPLAADGTPQLGSLEP